MLEIFSFYTEYILIFNFPICNSTCLKYTEKKRFDVLNVKCFKCKKKEKKMFEKKTHN